MGKKWTVAQHAKFKHTLAVKKQAKRMARMAMHSNPSSLTDMLDQTWAKLSPSDKMKALAQVIQ